MNIWKWKWGRLHLCNRDYDQIINFERLYGRWWLRLSASAIQERRDSLNVEAALRAKEMETSNWWELQKRKAKQESRPTLEVIEVLDLHSQVTEMAAPMFLPVADTRTAQRITTEA